MPGCIFAYLLPDAPFISAQGHGGETKRHPPDRLSPYRRNTITVSFPLTGRLRTSHASIPHACTMPFPPCIASGFLPHDARLFGQTPFTAATTRGLPAQVPLSPVHGPFQKKSPEDETPGFAENIPQGHTEKYGRIMRASCRAFVPACAPATPRSRKPEDTWPR